MIKLNYYIFNKKSSSKPSNFSHLKHKKYITLKKPKILPKYAANKPSLKNNNVKNPESKVTKYTLKKPRNKSERTDTDL